jgi:bisphosphoglycerate-dependent phosphoglycerate mutase
MESLVLKLGDRFASLIDMTLTKEGILEAFDCTIKLENIELDFVFASKIILTQKNISFIYPSRKNLNFCL